MKRWTIRILICLLLGAILNVAVAWGLAHDFPYTDWELLNKPDANEIAQWRDSTVDWSDLPLQYREVMWGNGVEIRFDTALNPDDLELRFDEQRYYSGYHGISTQIDSRLRITSGWPTAALAGERRMTVAGTSRPGIDLQHHRQFSPKKTMDELHTAIDDPTDRGWFNQLGFFPIAPIFPGFVINTLFYALICFALWFGPGMIRRRIRSARGRCIKCGYDLQGSTTSGGGCPECGWGRDGVSG